MSSDYITAKSLNYLINDNVHKENCLFSGVGLVLSDNMWKENKSYTKLYFFKEFYFISLRLVFNAVREIY